MVAEVAEIRSGIVRRMCFNGYWILDARFLHEFGFAGIFSFWKICLMADGCLLCGCWILDAGYWILDAGFWRYIIYSGYDSFGLFLVSLWIILDAGFQMLDSGATLIYSG